MAAAAKAASARVTLHMSTVSAAMNFHVACTELSDFDHASQQSEPQEPHLPLVPFAMGWNSGLGDVASVLFEARVVQLQLLLPALHAA